MVKTDPAKPMKIDRVDSPTGHGGTFVKDRAVAERMLGGASRHLNNLEEIQRDARVTGIHLTGNQLRGAIRRSKREKRHEAFKGSEGFEASARLTFRPSGPSDKALARKRAREFNQQYAGGQVESGSKGTASATD